MAYYIYNLQLISDLSQFKSNVNVGFICNQYSLDSAEKMLKELGDNYDDSDTESYVYLQLLIKTRKIKQRKTLVLNLAKKLALKNFVPAFNVLGYLYEGSEVVKSNLNVAADYYKKAHENGFAIGTYNLARCYINGYGVEYNFDLGVKLLNEAISKNYAPAMYYLGNSLLKGINGFTENHSEAFKYIKMAANQTYCYACFVCGYMFANGIGVEKNLTTAYGYYEKAAWFDDNDARIIVGNFNLEGKYVPQNYDRAFSYYLDAANAGYYPAYYNVGLCYYHGYGCYKDIERAKEWWLKGNSHGDEFCHKALNKYF